LCAFDDATELVRQMLRDGRRVVDVNTVMLRENMEHLPAIADLVADLGADEHRLFSCLRFPLQAGVQLPITRADAIRLWQVILPETRRRADRRGLHLEVCGECNTREDAEVEAFVAGRPNPLPLRGQTCVAPDSELSILIDGTMLPCQNPSFYVDLVQRPGNVHRQPVWEVLRSQAMAALVQRAGRHPSCGACICYRRARR
jgi:MoaA/NifB/PqqE/SkfB family radical SAM enzyme